MSCDEIAAAHAQLARMPRLGEIASVRRLGGLTNQVFHVEAASGPVCLRLPGRGTEEYINRENEAQAAWETARAGVSPALIFCDPRAGIMVTRYLANTVTMSPDLFKARAGAPARAGALFKKLHTSGAKFSNRFELFAMIDGYLKVLDGKDVELPEGYHDALAEAQGARGALARQPLPLVACHCDPLAENFLDSGERMWLVDWEYSGMNDPLWDLADLAVEGQFLPDQEAAMQRAYFDGEPRPAQRGRVVVYKAMCDLLWTLWGLIQIANKNTADDFVAYSTIRFARCKTLMATSEFGRHLAAVERG